MNSALTPILPQGIFDVLDAVRTADYTWRRPEVALEMEKQTYFEIVGFLERTGRLSADEAKRKIDGFGALRSNLDEFNRARTKAEKIRWMIWNAGPLGVEVVPWSDVSLPSGR